MITQTLMELKANYNTYKLETLIAETKKNEQEKAQAFQNRSSYINFGSARLGCITNRNEFFVKKELSNYSPV